MRRWIAIVAFAAWTLPWAGSSISAAPPAIDDILLTMKARQVLYQDDELRPFNIGINVVNRVAILFGPVPKIELGLRAESRLRGLFELSGVRNELDVIAPLPELRPERVPSPAPVSGQESRPLRPALGSPPRN